MRLNKILAIGMLLVGVPVVLLAAAARPSVADANSVGRLSYEGIGREDERREQRRQWILWPLSLPLDPATPVSPCRQRATSSRSACHSARDAYACARSPMPSGTPKAIPDLRQFLRQSVSRQMSWSRRASRSSSKR